MFNLGNLGTLWRDGQGQINWSGIAVVAFAIVFFGVGVARLVEFRDVGLSKFQRRTLMAFHLIGAALFSTAMALFGLDLTQQHKPVMYSIFASGVVILFPVHIYVAFRRRIKYGDPL